MKITRRTVDTMILTELLGGVTGCKCGKAHICPIKTVAVGNGALEELGTLCRDFKNILVVADENTLAAVGEEALSLLDGKIEGRVIFTGEKILVPNEEAIARIDENITEKTDLIVGIGSGVINDLCKYTSHKAHLPYFIVATAPSMDGYASVGAALILGGMKVTLNAAPPMAIIGDTRVLSGAPMDMIISGYGDIIGKYSCLNDWKLSKTVCGEYFCELVYRETLLKADEVRPLGKALLMRDEVAVKSLFEALVAVGVLMAYVGNSRPASGSEHHFSHYFEITGILRGEKYLSHGIDVFYSAAESAKMRGELLLLTSPTGKALPCDAREDISRIYGSLSEEVLSLQKKVGFYSSRDERLCTYEKKWQEICEILADAPTFSDMLDMLSEVGMDYAFFEDYYGRERIDDARLYAKDLKDRYTVLWMYYDIFCKQK